MPRMMRNHRNKAPIRRRTNPRNSNQSPTGVGHRDMVRQSKRWLLFTTVPYTNETNDFAYGLANINVATNAAGIANAVYSRLMTVAAQTYEEYRIRRVTIRAQPGLGFTNDRRIKSSIFARVDVNSQPTSATLDNLNTVICSESSVNKTFTERSNVKLVDFRPICYSSGSTGASSRPILNSQLQWYNIDERAAHVWRGATVAPVIPEAGLSPNTLGITCWVDVEVEFRTRRPDFANFLTVQLPQDSPDSPLEEEEKLATVMDTVLNMYDQNRSELLTTIDENSELEEETK